MFRQQGFSINSKPLVQKQVQNVVETEKIDSEGNVYIERKIINKPRPSGLSMGSVPGMSSNMDEF